MIGRLPGRALRRRRSAPRTAEPPRLRPPQHRHGPCYDPTCAACTYWTRIADGQERRLLSAERQIIALEQKP